MDDYSFPGYPAFLERAARGLDPSLARGACPAPLAAMANLCAQASTAAPGHVDEILSEAAVYRDRLAVAARAAELMLAEVSLAREAPGAAPAASVVEEARPSHARPSGRPTHHRP